MSIRQSNASAPPPRDAMTAGDQAPAGTPGTGENVCPRCGGSGRVKAGSGEQRCPECGGSGHVTTGIGGG
jgi:DnaJ-class molecular chaperone